jgi:hypothetical protein
VTLIIGTFLLAHFYLLAPLLLMFFAMQFGSINTTDTTEKTWQAIKLMLLWMTLGGISLFFLSPVQWFPDALSYSFQIIGVVGGLILTVFFQVFIFKKSVF